MDAAAHLVGLVVGDEPASWAALGLPVTGDRLTVGGVTIRLAGAGGDRGVLGWELDPTPPGEVDGLRLAVATTAPVAGDGATGRGYAVAALDHLVVTTPDVGRTTRALAHLGLSPRRTVDGARGDDGVRYRFFLLGTCVLELIGPVEPTGDGPARFGGLAFVGPDLDAFSEVTGPPRDAVQPGRRIVTLDTGAHEVSVPVAVLTPRPAR